MVPLLVTLIFCEEQLSQKFSERFNINSEFELEFSESVLQLSIHASFFSSELYNFCLTLPPAYCNASFLCTGLFLD